MKKKEPDGRYELKKFFLSCLAKNGFLNFFLITETTELPVFLKILKAFNKLPFDLNGEVGCNKQIQSTFE